MINANNYFSKIESIGINTLPETLLKGHEYVERVTGNGTSWDNYRGSETIQRIIDLYFRKVEDFIGTLMPKPASKGPAKPKAHKEKKAKKKERKVQKEKPYAKNVARISEEVKFIKRFVGLHNKVKSPQSILSLIKSLQRSIVQKIIRKTSPFAAQIELIQERLITIYKKMKGDTGMKISEDELIKFVAIAGGETVYPSLNIIKRYIGMQGKPMDDSLRERFVRQIEKALDSKIIDDDPYADKVKAIYSTLRKSKNNETFTITKSELNGLAGIVKSCTCKKELGSIYRMKRPQALKLKKKGILQECKKKTFSDSRGKGTCSHNRGLSGVLTAEEMATRKLDLLRFTSFWLSLFGNLGKNFTMMLHGGPHNGKTILLLKFAQYLAETFGNVLYVSSEEFASPTMTQKVNEFLNPRPSRLHFAENLNDPDLSMYDFIILDSVNDLKLKIGEYQAIRKEHPNKAFIFILQSTKAGDFRGGKDWEHLAEVVGEVNKGTVTVTKNRYAPKSVLNFFEQFGMQWSEPQQPSIEPKAYPLINDSMTTGESHY
ncbi:AAA family ATPase [Ohtaekwangia koreensis]|uniref:AAA+ ATPase domain-containing protein n=1 Tax=Ohtaekwangia koreensis TaxID=688867 RepID=A0A1T5J998_9BACT|nr:ATP-binding protein [Ohtaekwangia koreensis]SKC47818.1 hypothetical protein SAMN05660236_0876 [Ohtaekwangia koreensis]